MATISFSGIASGIDTESLISATSEATRATRVTPKEEKITELQSESSSLEDLKTMLNELKTIVDKFSTLNGGAIAKAATSSDETVVAASASQVAEKGSYNLKVTQLATNASYTFVSATKYNSNTAAIGKSGTVKINLGSESKTFNISASTTLAEMASNINNDFGDKVSASVINKGTVADPDYVVMVTSKESGSSAGISSVELTGDVKDHWESSSIHVEGKDATLELNGVEITRSANTIADLIPNVTLSLSNLGSAIVNIDTDKDQSETNLKEFVDCYNEIMDYIKENDEVSQDDSDDDGGMIYGSLSKTSTDESLISSLRSNISSAKNTTTGATIRILAEIGIKTTQEGKLELDTDTLSEALTKDATACNIITMSLGDTMGTTSGTIYQYVKYGGLIDIDIDGNDSQISDLNDRINRAESVIAQTEANMRARFARLESTMSELQSAQTSLSSLLGSG